MSTCNLCKTPVGMTEILRKYCVEEFGGLFLYIPSPRRNHEDQELWAWLKILKAKNVVAKHTWYVHANNAPERMRNSHPSLFTLDVVGFDICRVNRSKLSAFIDELF